MGVSLQVAAPGQKLDAQGYSTQKTPCDAKIVLPNTNYEVGLTKRADGSYSIKTDFYTGGVEQKLGKQCGKLVQLYGVHRATAAAQRLPGARITRQVGMNGKINLVVNVP